LHRKLKMLNVVTQSRGGVRMAVLDDDDDDLEDEGLAANNR
jgi:hypothetical protein